MNELLPTGGALYAFLAASFALAVTPGPGVLYIVARTLAQGRGAGLASVAGVALGNFGNAVGASLGLAALFAVSSAAFTVVRLAGAAYLVFLGVQALRPAQPSAPGGPPMATTERSRLFRDGFLVALLNPKTTLFFAAFLPQFLHATAAPALQSLALSAVFVLIAALTDSLYVLLAGVLAPSLRAGRVGGAGGRVLAAAVYIGLGVYTAFSQTQAGADSAR
jgi:threonine/homoserine/homoserine lactone efflux protein